MKTPRNAVIRLSAFSRSMYDAPRFVSRLGNLPPPWLLNFPVVHQSNRLEIYLKNSTERFFKISLIFITRVYGCFECITVTWILQFLLCFYLIHSFKIYKLRIQRMFQPSIVDKWKIIDYQYFRRISMYLSDPRDRFPPRERSFHLPVYISIRNYEAVRPNDVTLQACAS